MSVSSAASCPSSPRSWIEIDAHSFKSNCALIGSFKNNGSFSLSLKAHAYGHGILTLGKLAEEESRISSLHVSNKDAFDLLRNNAITKDIIIDPTLNPEPLPTLLCYGLPEHMIDSVSQNSFRTLLAWKTKIMRIKKIASNVSVGYARSFITKRPSIIGILPIGYADGLPRLLSNKGTVMLQGISAPIVGLISMNLIAIDITDIKNASQDDEVTVIGPENVSAMAQAASCTQMELVSRLHGAIPRLIVPEFFDKKYAQPHRQNADFF